jgi:hypothetical protein
VRNLPSKAGIEISGRNFVNTSRQVAVGQRYRVVRADGVPSALWEVTRVFTPWHGGFEHACIKGVDGLGRTITLANSVIADKTRFVPE